MPFTTTNLVIPLILAFPLASLFSHEGFDVLSLLPFDEYLLVYALLATLSIYTLYHIYQFFFVPIYYIRTAGSIQSAREKQMKSVQGPALLFESKKTWRFSTTLS